MVFTFSCCDDVDSSVVLPTASTGFNMVSSDCITSTAVSRSTQRTGVTNEQTVMTTIAAKMKPMAQRAAHFSLTTPKKMSVNNAPTAMAAKG